ncbi:TetR/AcrR family transcriptional regulator [Gryllotalpicola protaetiae]|uniref:TetR/AcrR family transcriptional regulator n=1 Tax=Gryllotalpicola protaetiae TaxID=2419771 RepID=A0A387BQA7_9MICO|nr:TetR/AcrR family transcriptional regulator [Gryllotalpicola protaetiae]AYG03210.1 TetR/AcrR family transcriptional regulator [Gryllotalpicola protaetiae]
MSSFSPEPRVAAAADRVQKPQARTAETRRRILSAATTVFGAKGYNKGSLIEIAELAGMTHAGVLHHFGSKDNLLIAVLEYRDDEDVAHLERHQAPTGDELLRHMLGTVRLNLTRAGLVQAYAVLSAESVTDSHPAAAFFRSRFDGLRRMIADAYATVAPEGTTEERLLAAASATIAVMDGLQVQWLHDETVDMPEAVEATIVGLIAWLRGAAQPL